MAPLLWIGLAGVLALTWLQPDMRAAALPNLGLQIIIAVGCGLGAVALKRMHPGSARRRGVALLFLACWVAAVGWYYLNRDLNERFEWASSIVYGFGVALIPVGVAVWVSTLGASAIWTAIQVSTIAFAAAPIWPSIALLFSVLIFHEGP